MGKASMQIRKVCVVITTRGNYAKVKPVIEGIQRNKLLELQIVAAGGAILNRYGNISKSLEENGFSISKKVHYIVEGEDPVTMAKSSGLVANEFSSVFEDLDPDLVLVIADRYECLPLAMTAAYMNIPVAHMEGGEVSGSIDESIRHAITKLSHLHFPATKSAAKRLERLGEQPKAIHPVGATSLDVIKKLDLDNLESLIALQHKSGLGPVIDLEKPYIIVIQHPVTTEYESNFDNVQETVIAINKLKYNTIWIWPNMDAGSDGVSKALRLYHENYNPSFVHFFRSLAIEDYAPLLNSASCIVGNSSSGIREAGFLGTPSVNVGSRQNERERCSNTLDVPHDRFEIEKAVKKQISHGPYPSDYRYGDGQASEKLIKTLCTVELNVQKRITY